MGREVNSHVSCFSYLHKLPGHTVRNPFPYRIPKVIPTLKGNTTKYNVPGYTF